MKIYILLLFIIVSPVAEVYAQKKQIDSHVDNDEKTALPDKIRSQFENDFTFSGKVVDLDHNPIPDVEVEALVLKLTDNASKLFSESKTYNLKTDSKGMFSVSGSGIKIIVNNFWKKGYKKISGFNNQNVFSTISLKNNSIKDDKFVFYLRKQGETACLIKDNAGTVINKDEEQYMLDTVSVKLWDREKYVKQLMYSENFDFVGDFVVLRNKTEGNDGLVVSFYSKRGKLKLLDKRIYVADKDGYVSSVSINVKNDENKKFYLLYKGRSEKIDSIIAVDLSSRFNKLQNDSIATVKFEVWTNVFGNGILDDDDTLEFVEREKLISDGIKNIKQKQNLNPNIN